MTLLFLGVAINNSNTTTNNKHDNANTITTTDVMLLLAAMIMLWYDNAPATNDHGSEAPYDTTVMIRLIL